MIQFDLPKQQSSILKVMGIGGGGSNAVNYMFSENIEGVDFIICNTDAKALEQSPIANKIQLGPHLTQGLGAGANPEVGKQATEESLEEIKRILEVNTKMVFICAGMGGGTGTGGAPIIAKICREMGILTVGIVTTPFGFEGPRRQRQAEKGIKELEPFMDTLLVISNDKLRMQYRDLKMKEAFSKADNVLATAAKCITDIINSRGHIIVDFADVCTVMRNGGVAILGNSNVSGADRAQRAIEEALSSPLLNDDDIRGAKWILININTAEGEHECTMDEFEFINDYVRMQAGDETDVIVGMGYDNTLNDSLAITLIATGFEQKDPFSPIKEVEKQPLPEKEKLVLVMDEPAQTTLQQQESQQSAVVEDALAPKLTPESEVTMPHTPQLEFLFEEEINDKIIFELKDNTVKETTPKAAAEQAPVKEELKFIFVEKPVEKPRAKSSGGILRKPANIYAEETIIHVQPPVVATSTNSSAPKEEAPKQSKPVQPFFPLEEEDLQLVYKENSYFDSAQAAHNLEETEENKQKRKAAERIDKLRKLSFNINGNDPNSEFDAVPAYVRRNLELMNNTQASVENFYSKYTVTKDEKENTNISSINTFLDGKKPD
ncbi:MAG: cell division protein FtsZ [Chitinophagaceae bacterium]|jgi:cell division protein FtsZ|nr:cell division protein FtsZ [Chitinophagaceae bacterium]